MISSSLRRTSPRSLQQNPVRKPYHPGEQYHAWDHGSCCRGRGPAAGHKGLWDTGELLGLPHPRKPFNGCKVEEVSAKGVRECVSYDCASMSCTLSYQLVALRETTHLKGRELGSMTSLCLESLTAKLAHGPRSSLWQMVRPGSGLGFAGGRGWHVYGFAGFAVFTGDVPASSSCSKRTQMQAPIILP